MFENMMLNDLEKVTGGCQVNYDQNGNPYITPAHMDCAKAPTTALHGKTMSKAKAPHGKTMIKAVKIDQYPPLGH